MERVIPEPDVTTKQGRLKSGKTRHEQVHTVEDLAKLEVLDEVNTVNIVNTVFFLISTPALISVPPLFFQVE